MHLQSLPRHRGSKHFSVTKAYALDLICKRIGVVPSEVVASGDEDNDLPMLSFAGYGIAMGNASQLVKDAADYITFSNDENGVAAALDYLGVI